MSKSRKTPLKEEIKNSISKIEDNIIKTTTKHIENQIYLKKLKLKLEDDYNNRMNDTILKELNQNIEKEIKYFDYYQEKQKKKYINMVDYASYKYNKKYDNLYKSKFKKNFEIPLTSDKDIKVRDKLKKHLCVEDLYIKNKKIFESINSEYKEFLKLINKEKININYNLFPKKFNFDNFKFLDVSKLDYNDIISYYSIVIFLSEIKLSYFSYRKLIKSTSSFDFIKFTKS